MPAHKLTRRAVLAAGLACLAVPAFAAFPDKPVKLLVGYAPGGATDIIARLLARHLAAKWGQQVVVENKPGASGMLAAEQVVNAGPDGYTLLLGYTPEVSINKLVFKSMRYDPVTDLKPIALAASAPLVLVRGPRLAVDSIKDLLALKGNTQSLFYGSPGTGGQQHMAGEMLGRLAGLPVTHVPYKGTSLAVTDLLGGQIDLFFATTPPLLQNIRAGKLKPLLVAGDRRESLLPDVPTAVEAGLPKLQLSNWFGLFGPKGLADATVARLATDTVEALNDANMVKALGEQGLRPMPLQGAMLRDFIEAEMQKYKAIVADTRIAAD